MHLNFAKIQFVIIMTVRLQSSIPAHSLMKGDSHSQLYLEVGPKQLTVLPVIECCYFLKRKKNGHGPYKQIAEFPAIFI